MRHFKNRYHTELLPSKRIHSFDIVTTRKRSAGSFYLIFTMMIINFIIGFIATTYFWELTSDLNWLFIEVLPILCFCSGTVPQKENVESVKIFSFTVIS